MKFTSRLLSVLTVALISSVAVSAHAEDYPRQHFFDARTVSATHMLNRAAEVASLDVVVNFDTASSKLNKTAEKQVAKLAAAIKQHPRAHYIVAGYTDSKGKAALNQRLSHQRALTVMHALVKLGVPAEQLTAQGYGETDPVASNATAEGRAANRRVGVLSSSGMIN